MQYSKRRRSLIECELHLGAGWKVDKYVVYICGSKPKAAIIRRLNDRNKDIIRAPKHFLYSQ